MAPGIRVVHRLQWGGRQRHARYFDRRDVHLHGDGDERDGQTSTATISYTVGEGSPGPPAGASAGSSPVIVPPGNVTPPAINGTLKPGTTLACFAENWTNEPTFYAYQWYRDGTLLAGFTGSTYVLGTLDQGTTLTCVVTAINAAGQASATSKPVKVPIPYVPRCPAATGKMTGTTIGLIQLGMTCGRARYLYRQHSNRGKQYEDFFCLTPIGVRVGYASPKLLKGLSRRERALVSGSVVWASTSDPYYSLDGIRAGESITTASLALGIEPPFHIGLNYWYLARKTTYTAVLKVRRRGSRGARDRRQRPHHQPWPAECPDALVLLRPGDRHAPRHAPADADHSNGLSATSKHPYAMPGVQPIRRLIHELRDRLSHRPEPGMSTRPSTPRAPRTPHVVPSLLGRTRSGCGARSCALLSGSGAGEPADALSTAYSRRDSLWLARLVALTAAALLFLALPHAASADLSWSGPIAVDSGNVLYAVACPAANQCTALDGSGNEVTFEPTSPGTPTPIPIDSTADHYLSGVGTSNSQCTAIDNYGNEVTFDPSSPGTPTPTLLFGDEVVDGLACPSVSQCIALGDYGTDVVTFDPTSPGTPTEVPINEPFGYPIVYSGFACPSASQCTDIDRYEEATFDPSSPGSPPATIDPTLTTIDSSPLIALACPATSQCTAVDGDDNEVTFDPTSPGTPTPTPIVGLGPVDGDGVACPSTSQCTAVSYTENDEGLPVGQAVTFDPTSPGAPTPTAIAGAGALEAVACYSVALCVAVDDYGNAFVGQKVFRRRRTPRRRRSRAVCWRVRP